MKRPLLAILLATSFALTGARSTQALHTSAFQSESGTSSVLTARDQSTRPNEDAVNDDKKLELETRKQELEQKLADKRAAITDKLMGDRADKCEKKQVNINAMLDKRIETAQKHFDTFKSIQDKLNVLVDNNEITVENEVALQRVMNLLQGRAQGSIETLKKNDFKCNDADPVAPGAIVKDQIAIAKQDLKNYRDSIKDYAQAVKASIGTVSKSETPSSQTPDQEAPVQETPSTEQTIEGVSQ